VTTAEYRRRRISEQHRASRSRFGSVLLEIDRETSREELVDYRAASQEIEDSRDREAAVQMGKIIRSLLREAVDPQK
jgi:hypothetical protein